MYATIEHAIASRIVESRIASHSVNTLMEIVNIFLIRAAFDYRDQTHAYGKLRFNISVVFIRIFAKCYAQRCAKQRGFIVGFMIYCLSHTSVAGCIKRSFTQALGQRTIATLKRERHE